MNLFNLKIKKIAIAFGWAEPIAETDLPDDQFPEVCPFSLEQILSSDFWLER